MKRMNNKGQGAMEYLMTYGWAILVVMIVGVVLWQLGVFGGASGNVNRATGFTTLKPFDRSIQYTPGAAGTLNATFTNAAGTPITVTSVKAGGDCVYTTAASTLLLIGGGTGATANVPIAGGDIIKFRCGPVTTPIAGALTNKNKGDSFATNITITYTESVAGTPITRSDSGRLTGRAG